MIAPSPDQIMKLAARHFHAGEFSQAEILARQIPVQSPRYADALDMLGVMAARRGQVAEAAGLLQRAVAVRPGEGLFQHHLGNVQRELGRLAEATAAFSRAVQLQPTNFEAWAQLGEVYSAAGRLDLSEKAYRQAVALKPDYLEAWNNLGLVLHRMKNYGEARAIFLRCLALKPGVPEVHNNLGNALQAIGSPEAALAEFHKAIALRPQFAAAHNNAGSALRDLERFDEARAAFDQAIAIAGDFASAYVNRGYMRDASEMSEALADFRHAIKLAPDFAAAHWNYALLLLRLGDLPHGWAEYEWRWRWEGFTTPARAFSRPRWDGSDPAVKAILLHAEQGIGDTIQFIRFAMPLAQRGARVIVECQPGLVPLLASVGGVAEVYAEGSQLPPFDLHLPILSLPLMFGTTLETIPRETPYIHADAGRATEWRKRLQADGNGFRVGVAWAGNPGHIDDRRRSMALADLAPLGLLPGVRFYNLQMGSAAEQARSHPGELKLIDHTAALGDWADTAAFIANLDCVISVDTAVAHLAGAMGKPTWVMLANMPDWRWMLERSDSPWYPTFRLFRQPRRGDWASVVKMVAVELKDLLLTPQTP